MEQEEQKEHDTEAFESMNTTHYTHDDIKMLMTQCVIDEQRAYELLEETEGDIVEAIALHLKPELRKSKIHQEDKTWNVISPDEVHESTDLPSVADSEKVSEVNRCLSELRVITSAKNKVLDEKRQQQKESQSTQE